MKLYNSSPFDLYCINPALAYKVEGMEIMDKIEYEIEERNYFGSELGSDMMRDIRYEIKDLNSYHYEYSSLGLDHMEKQKEELIETFNRKLNDYFAK